MVVVMENQNYSGIIGQSNQPYTNSLAQGFGLATQSYALGHPSLPDYLALVTGSDQGVTDDGSPSVHRFPAAQTLADQLQAAGVSRKAYVENLPADPTQDSGLYAVRHFPWAYFPNTAMPVADASNLIGDLNSPSAPDFVWYTPNMINDEHSSSVQTGDAFLASFIPSVQATDWYKNGGQIIITWDESANDNSGINGGDGGHVPSIVVSRYLTDNPQQYSGPVDSAGIFQSLEHIYQVPFLGAAATSPGDNIDHLLYW
jgi:acid phosphatase